MKLSVITVNLNNSDGLRKTIESIVSQRCRDFEWIVIDGGSDDGSRELIERYAEHISYWVSEPDKGIYNAMNKGILASHGEYLLFMNSGDRIYDEDVLGRAIPMLQGCDFYVGYELLGDTVIRNDIFTPATLFHTLTEAALPHQSMFINRSVFVKYGLYREDFRTISDWVMYYKALIIGNASIEKLDFMVSVFDLNGISQNEWAVSEREMFFAEIPNVNHAVRFYYRNHDMVCALKESRLIFFLFRVYYYFYRVRKKKER